MFSYLCLSEILPLFHFSPGEQSDLSSEIEGCRLQHFNQVVLGGRYTITTIVSQPVKGNDSKQIYCGIISIFYFT